MDLHNGLDIEVYTILSCTLCLLHRMRARGGFSLCSILSFMLCYIRYK